MLLMAAMLLVACGNKEMHNEKERSEKERSQNESNEVAHNEKVRSPLPFDTDEFVNSYNNALADFEDYVDSEKLSTEDDSLTLTFGDLIEAQLLLNTLNKFSDGETINELAKEMVTGLTEDGYYINEENINGFDININAPDMDSVMVVITRE